MRLFSTYSVKIKHYNRIFRETVTLYRNSVDFLIKVCLDEWDTIANISQNQLRQQYVEHLCHQTKKNPSVKYPTFDRRFYKFPSYLRRSAINEAIGKVSSYQSNLANWDAADPDSCGNKPSLPRAGYILSVHVQDSYVRTDRRLRDENQGVHPQHMGLAYRTGTKVRYGVYPPPLYIKKKVFPYPAEEGEGVVFGFPI